MNVIGSRAENLATICSDYDILIVVPDTTAPRQRAVLSNYALGRLFEILVLSEAEYLRALEGHAWHPRQGSRTAALDFRCQLTHGYCLFGEESYDRLRSYFDQDAHPDAAFEKMRQVLEREGLLSA